MSRGECPDVEREREEGAHGVGCGHFGGVWSRGVVEWQVCRGAEMCSWRVFSWFLSLYGKM